MSVRGPLSPGRLLRAFRTICDVCLEDVPGELRIQGEEVYHHKLCPTHGDRRWLISRNGDLYARYDRHYHTLFPVEEAPPVPIDTHVYITNSCNQGCDYCAAEANRYEYFGDFEPAELEKRLKSYRGAKISLVGGEPLRHPRFFEFVKAIEKAGKTTVVFTNGIAFSDEAAVRRLMEVSRSRCEVRMTFEGFAARAYDHLPVPNLLETKLAALGNFRKYGTPVTLGHTISPAEQHDKKRAREEMRSIMEFGMRERFARGLTFRSLAALGGTRHLAPEEVLSVDQVMDEVAAASPVPIRRRDAYLSQRLVNVMARIFGLPSCEYVQTAVLFQRGGQWVGLDHFFDCDRLERRLDERIGRWPVTRIGLLAAFLVDLLASARPARVPALIGLGLGVLPMFTNRFDFASIPAGILPLNASTVCDRHNLDSSVARRCEKIVLSQVGGDVVKETTSQMAVRYLRLRTWPQAAHTPPGVSAGDGPP